MAREFFKDLPNTTTPLTASRLNGLLNGDEALGSIVVDDVSGKNLFDGVLESGNINDSGQETSSTTTIRSINKYEVIGGQTYICSYTTSENTYLNVVACYDASGTFIQRLTGMRKTAFTVPSNCKYIRTAFYNNNGLTVATFNSTVSNVQLEKGSTATEYTEYKQPVKKTSIGVKESCTFYANDFKCKNLFSGIMYNGIINQSGAYVTNNARITNTTANGFFLPQGTYTLSIADLDACTIVIKNASGTVIQDLADSWKTLPFTFTTIQDGYICFSAKKNNDATLNPNDYAPQLEIGSEATSYTPYKEFLPEVETIDISSYKTSNVSSVTRASMKRYGKLVKINIVVSNTSASPGTILFSGLPFKPSELTELNSVNNNNQSTRCNINANGDIAISTAQVTAYYINGVFLLD